MLALHAETGSIDPKSKYFHAVTSQGNLMIELRNLWEPHLLRQAEGILAKSVCTCTLCIIIASCSLLHHRKVLSGLAANTHHDEKAAKYAPKFHAALLMEGSKGNGQLL
mmetsp:Transcript_108288/g.170766  ORF Transcript_108288/g.170766 Transcript_108288/m.170766 type:complete len:109 (+) Transcript_108288:390-716(+)